MRPPETRSDPRIREFRVPPFSGLALKLKRLKAGARVRDVASVMCVRDQRVCQIEALYRVRPELASRYLAALGEVVARQQRVDAGASAEVA